MMTECHQTMFLLSNRFACRPLDYSVVPNQQQDLYRFIEASINSILGSAAVGPPGYTAARYLNTRP
jgi:hypothetical protein